MYDNSSTNLSDSVDANDLSNSSDSIHSRKSQETYSPEELINNIESGLDNKNSAVMILSRAIENCDAQTGLFDKKSTQIVKADLNKAMPFLNKIGEKFNYLNRCMGSMCQNLENIQEQNIYIRNQNNEIKQQNNELITKIQLYEKERARISDTMIEKINECYTVNKNMVSSISDIQQQQKEIQKVTIDAFNASKEASDTASENMDRLEILFENKVSKGTDLTQKIANIFIPQDISNIEDIIAKTCRSIAHDPESQNKKITKKFLKDYTGALLASTRSDIEKQVTQKLTKQYDTKMEKQVRIKVKQAEERIKEQYNQKLKEHGCNSLIH